MMCQVRSPGRIAFVHSNDISKTTIVLCSSTSVSYHHRCQSWSPIVVSRPFCWIPNNINYKAACWEKSTTTGKWCIVPFCWIVSIYLHLLIKVNWTGGIPIKRNVNNIYMTSVERQNLTATDVTLRVGTSNTYTLPTDGIRWTTHWDSKLVTTG